MIYTWLAIFVALLVIEAMTINLVTIWFAIGALASSITCLFTDSIIIQLTVFLVVTVITLLLTRPIAKKYLIPTHVCTNYDRAIGMTAIVTKKITKHETGEVKLDGKYWTAKSSKTIEVGEKVEVLSIEGVKLIVKSKEDDI